MKTSWVLTEDDKSKVSAKRPLSSEPSPDINIKTETDIDAPVADPSVAVKNRHPSSPTPFKSSNLSNQFFQGDNPHIYQGKNLTKKLRHRNFLKQFGFLTIFNLKVKDFKCVQKHYFQH